MVGIKGTRGIVKTTLMFQYQKFDLGNPDNALYITAAHHPWFYTHTLLETAEDWYKQEANTCLLMKCTNILQGQGS